MIRLRLDLVLYRTVFVLGTINTALAAGYNMAAGPATPPLSVGLVISGPVLLLAGSGGLVFYALTESVWLGNLLANLRRRAEPVFEAADPPLDPPPGYASMADLGWPYVGSFGSGQRTDGGCEDGCDASWHPALPVFAMAVHASPHARAMSLLMRSATDGRCSLSGWVVRLFHRTERISAPEVAEMLRRYADEIDPRDG